MRRFCVCCIMALCVILSGCARSQPETLDQPDIPEEIPDGEAADLSQTETLELSGETPCVVQAPPEPDPAPEEESSNLYVGTWSDPDAPQYRMEIAGGDKDGYTIEIRWSRDGQETDVWQLAGTYDEIWQGIAYTGAKYTEDADGQRTPVPDREEISGLICFEDDGSLCWIDDFDHAGADLAFEKS